MNFSELDLDPLLDCLRTLGLELDTSGNCREILNEIDFRCLSFIDNYYNIFDSGLMYLAISPSQESRNINIRGSRLGQIDGNRFSPFRFMGGI